MKKLKLACCGGWHTHAMDFPLDRAGRYCSHIPYEFSAVWDDDINRGKQWAAKMGCRFEPDYDRLCSDSTIDGFLITSSTAKHADLTIRAANSGKAVFIEKALTANLKEAYEMQEAVKRNGIHFTMSDPVEKPELVYAKSLIEKGTLGKITSFRLRCGHSQAITNPEQVSQYYNRAETGGGIFYDMGHHIVYIFYWLFGIPQYVTGLFSEFTEKAKASGTDDLGCMIFKYSNGAVGVAESGWVSAEDSGFVFDLYGTDGLLRWDSTGLRFRLGTDLQNEWTPVPNEELPESSPYPLRYWMESIYYNTPNTKYDIDSAVHIAEIIHDAYRNGSSVPKFDI